MPMQSPPPEPIDLSTAAALTLLRQGKVQDALEYAEGLLASDAISQAQTGLGPSARQGVHVFIKTRSLLQTADLPGAEATCAQIAGLPQSSGSATRALALSMAFVGAEKGELAPAKLTAQGLRGDPLLGADALLLLARISLAEGRPEEAWELFKDALKIEAGFRDAVLGLFNSGLSLGKNRESLPFVEEYLLLEPLDWDLRTARATIWFLTGDDAGAKRELNTVLAVMPSHAVARGLLERITNA